MRHWGSEEARTSTPDFADAVRWAVFAEATAPELEEARTVQNTPLTSDMSPEHRGALARAKMQAKDRIELLTEVLFPEDDDG